MPLSDSSSKQHTFNIEGDVIRFTRVRNDNAHIVIAGDPDSKIITDNKLKAHQGFQADDFESKDGVNLFQYNSATSRIVFESNVDFSGVSVSGISGGGGGGGTITTQDVDSMNFPGQTLENELDDMTAKTLANTNRLTGLPAFRILASDILGNAEPSSVTIDSVASRTFTNIFTGNNFFLSTNGVGFGTLDYLGTKWAKIDAVTQQQIELRGDDNPELIVGDGTNSIKLLLDTTNNKNKIETTRTLEINNSINLPSGSTYNIGGFPIDTTDLDNSSNIPLLDASLNTFTGNIKGASITTTTGFTIDNSASVTGATTIIANDLGNNRVNFTHFGGGVYNFIGQLHTNGSQIALADLSDGGSVLTTSGNNIFTGNNTFRTGTTFQASGSSDSSTILNNGIITLLRTLGAEINLDGINIGHTSSSLKVNNGGMDIASGNTYKVNGTQIALADLSDGGNVITTSANNTFTGTNIFRTNTLFQGPASLDGSTININGRIDLVNSSFASIDLNSIQIRDGGFGFQVIGGGVDIPATEEYRIGGVQIASTDLSNTALIPLLNVANIYTAKQDYGSTGLDTELIEFASTTRNIKPVAIPASHTELEFNVELDDEFLFKIDSVEHARIRERPTNPSLFIQDNSSILGTASGFSKGFHPVASQNWVNATIQESTLIPTLAGTNTFTGTNTFETNTIYQGSGSTDSTTIAINGKIILVNTTSFSSIDFNTMSLFDDGFGLAISGGGLNLPTGESYRINGVALQSSDLSDSTNIPLLDTNNTFTDKQTFDTIIDTTRIEYGAATRYTTYDTINNYIQNTLPAGQEFKWYIGTTEFMRIKETALNSGVFIDDQSSIIPAVSRGFLPVATQTWVNATLSSSSVAQNIITTLETGVGLNHTFDNSTITPTNPANELRLDPTLIGNPSITLYYRNDRISKFTNDVSFTGATNTIDIGTIVNFSNATATTLFGCISNFSGAVNFPASTGNDDITFSRETTHEADIKLEQGNEVKRLNDYTDLSSTTTTQTINYLSKIDELFTDYRRKFNSIELFGDDSTGDPNDGTDDRWTTGTGFMKEYESNGTQFTGSGSPPEYAEISILKFGRNLLSSDSLHPSKYNTFVHNNETNSTWDYLGASGSGQYIFSINFNGGNRVAGSTQQTDYGFIDNTYIISSSAIVNVIDNNYGFNDTTPDYSRLPTSNLAHTNASTSTDETSLVETPSFYLKRQANSPAELVFRFPIGATYIYTSANVNFKKNINVLVKAKKLMDWSHFSTDYTTPDYP